MKNNIKNIYDELTDSVLELDAKRAVNLANEVLSKGMDVNKAITQGLIRGMEIAGKKYETGEFYIPELIISSDVMYAGMNILKPYSKSEYPAEERCNLRAIIGVIEGDTHEIGKDLVKLMLETAGFQMIDLGTDVPIRRFVDEALIEKIGLICISSLISTSLVGMKDIMDLIEFEGVRDRFKVLVGGASVTPVYARSIGADGYAPNAVAAVRVAKELLEPNLKKRKGKR
jgi:dimethylamine corrinoid protein